MLNEVLTLATALIVSVMLSTLYAWWLEQMHDTYRPKMTVVTVIIGNGGILDTLMILEHQFGLTITTMRVLYIMCAWGLPITIWQIWQEQQRKLLERKYDDAAEGSRRTRTYQRGLRADRPD